MKQLAKVSLAVAALLASGWGSVVAITACSSSSDNSGSSSSSGGGSSSGGSSSGSSSSSGAGSSSGACTLNAGFGNMNTGTCPACAACVAPYCCSSINDCYNDNGCAALINCEFYCYSNNALPWDAGLPEGGDCPTLCTAGVDAGAASKQLYTAESNCWEGTGPGSMTCANACACGSTGDDGGSEGGGDDGGGTDSATGSDAPADAPADAGAGG
jgi:hypothetical protein